jgi:heme/copper-type cytochrome/quinol oxidase subunit 3
LLGESSRGCLFPKHPLIPVDPFAAPAFGSLLLFTSGVSVTISCKELKSGSKNSGITKLVITVGLGVCFLLVQAEEFSRCGFRITDGENFSSCFFFLTGLHGLHVSIGVVFMVFCLCCGSLGGLKRKRGLIITLCS